MVNHPNRSTTLTRHQKLAIKALNPWSEQEASLRAALEPTRHGALTGEQAECLIWATVRAMRQGNSIDHRVPAIIDDIFGQGKPAVPVS